ncbi:hypothetical protein HGI79_17430 [Clostridium sp. DJ247]|nr:hypothetical protein [Clostridium sp. DJ247]
MRADNGTDKLIAFFKELIEKDINKAVSFINDTKLKFPSLFALIPLIEESNILNSLDLRNKITLEIINDMLTNSKKHTNMEYLCYDYIQVVHSSLKWILVTGASTDGLNEKLDEVLDVSAILLAKVYKDKTVLPTIVDMIFERYKKGFLIHDLIWAFFEAGDPNSLILIANHLKTGDLQEIELASKLLSFIPGINMGTNIDGNKNYLTFLYWIKENIFFLHFTGESFQQSSNPTPYVVVLKAKYLCKNVSIDTGKIIESLTPRENQLIETFSSLDGNTKVLLANFSVTVYRKNIVLWNKWIQYDISEQISIAKVGGVK